MISCQRVRLMKSANLWLINVPWLLWRIISGFHIWSYFIRIYAESQNKSQACYEVFWRSRSLSRAYLCFWNAADVPNKAFKKDSIRNDRNHGWIHLKSLPRIIPFVMNRHTNSLSNVSKFSNHYVLSESNGSPLKNSDIKTPLVAKNE